MMKEKSAMLVELENALLNGANDNALFEVVVVVREPVGEVDGVLGVVAAGDGLATLLTAKHDITVRAEDIVAFITGDKS